MTSDQLLAAMEDQRLTVLYADRTETGTQEVAIPCGELPAFLADPVTWLADHYQVSRGQYLAWHESGYTVRCAGSTSRGKPCRNAVEGGSTVGLARWVELQGEYCHLHSIGRAEEAWERS
jgi:hypothetical protein